MTRQDKRIEPPTGRDGVRGRNDGATVEIGVEWSQDKVQVRLLDPLFICKSSSRPFRSSARDHHLLSEKSFACLQGWIAGG
jgi:hypothetical protein